MQMVHPLFYIQLYIQMAVASYVLSLSVILLWCKLL